MSFTLKWDNSQILKVIIETLSTIIDETEFKVTPKEFVITAIDPSRICLLKLSIKKENFDDYKCGKATKVGLNLDDLDKILKRSAANDSIEIDFNETEQKIKIKMKRPGMARPRTFSLALLEIDAQEIPMDKLLSIEYPAWWKIKPDFIVEAIKDAEIYSEVLNIKAVEEEGLIFSSIGQIGEMEYTISIGDLRTEGEEPESEEELYAIAETCSGAYPLTFLKGILKIASITESLEMSLKTDHPLKLIFKLLEGGELSYFLAPRVEEAEFDEDEDDMDEF